MRQSDEAIRTLIAREIWRYNECPWDFDNPEGHGRTSEATLHRSSRVPS